MTKRPTEQQARRLAEVIQQEWSKDSQHLPNTHSRSDCWEALRTAIVLAERQMIPGPQLIEQWKQMLPNERMRRDEDFSPDTARRECWFCQS